MCFHKLLEIGLRVSALNKSKSIISGMNKCVLYFCKCSLLQKHKNADFSVGTASTQSIGTPSILVLLK